ncbi:MAG: hypothetical protein P8J27_03795 [Mariniblastus sp.]|nr:hypothetical protein [Mariniblastus sp.]
MTQKQPSNQPFSNTTFGFMTVVEVPSLGHCGGLLLVSNIGRPIEFHFTAPVASNRTQEIMYGKTYSGFLCGDRIGAALVDKARRLPTMFVTDSPDILPVCELIDTSLILVPSTMELESKPEPFDGKGLKSFQIDNDEIYCLNTPENQLNLIRQQAATFASVLPFDEPFERIRQAIGEAHQVLKVA